MVDGMPAALTERAERLLRAAEQPGAAGWVPAPCRNAATVALIRDCKEGLQVFLQRRSRSLAFAAGMYVFPGGVVEAQDFDSDLPWRSQPGAGPFRTGVDVETAHLPGSEDPVPAGSAIGTPARQPAGLYGALVAAAVRETLEEAGVLVAADGKREVGRYASSSKPSAEVDVVRKALVSGESLANVLVGAGVWLDPLALVPFRHWLTPGIESRRYDTRFFVAVAARRNDARVANEESDDAQWISPRRALDQVRDGRAAMLPPTIDMLQTLCRHDHSDSVLAARPTRISPIIPRPHRREDAAIGWSLVDGYTGGALAAGEGPLSLADATGGV